MTSSTTIRRTSFALAAMAAALLGGCADGVELNGKIFDALGVSTASVEKSRPSTKLAERSGLVVPPDLSRLPEPGSVGRVDPQLAQDPSFPVDVDEKKRMARADLERQQAEFCKKHYETNKALAQTIMADTARGPLGPCAANPMLKGVLPSTR